VHDRGEFDGQLWISMDYVDGTDAAQLLHERYPNGMPPDEALEIVTAIAEALDYAHQRDLLHRDVKPANILLAAPESGEQRILLADFGIARWVDDASGLTATNMTVGTVSYAAPEQLMGAQLDGRADQYALAATAFHLLTGSLPFAHSNPTVVISQHLNAPAPKLAEARPDLAGLDPAMSKALAKDPAERFERCVDFARALGHRVGGQTDATRLSGAARAEVPHPKQASGSLLRPVVVIPAITFALLLIGAIVFGGVEFSRDKPSDTATATRSATPATTPASTPATATSASPSPAPPPTSSATSSVPAAPAAVIGASCPTAGATGSTASGATAYCSALQPAGNTIWSLHPGDVSSPDPLEMERDVRVCMEQTGQTRLRCREDIRRSNMGG
jgi:serine/threonine-protein kinase